MLVRVRYISLDAANRAWMQGATYRSAVTADTVMAGGGLGEVVASNAPGFVPGDLVFGDIGWQDFAVVPARGLVKLPRIEPVTHLLSIYGVAGLTAYFGLLNVGRPKAGDTVVVSAAAGSVGSIVGQIARIKGCRAVGIAGGQAKCDWLVSELGFDAAVDYKAGSVFKALKAAAPNGIDVYFDNVGGDHLDAAFALANDFARFAICGMIDVYNDGKPQEMRHLIRTIPARIRMEGFIYTDQFFDCMEEFYADMAGLIASGAVTMRETVRDGVEAAPDAFLGLFSGENIGKMLVRI